LGLKLNVRAVLVDFDGTVVRGDMLTLACKIAGKEADSIRLNEAYMKGELKGIEPLMIRINFLKGLSTKQIDAELEKHDYLMPGAREFFAYLNKHKILSILNSGNLMSTLAFYQKMLGITYIVGSKPKMKGNIIQGISAEEYSCNDFKLADSIKILEGLKITHNQVVAIGDSPADKSIFQYAAKSIAINPRDGIEKYADYIIRDDLSKAIEIIEKLRK
jgi:phosphoserine phosphatase